MPRKSSICLIHGHDAALLLAGVILKCSEHGHIDPFRAQLLISGTGARPWLDPDYEIRAKENKVTERHDSTAVWAMLPDGESSEKYLVLMEARSWQCAGGAQQFLPLGSTKQPRKRGRTHIRPDRRSSKLITDSMLRPCRPSLMRQAAANKCYYAGLDLSASSGGGSFAIVLP